MSKEAIDLLEKAKQVVICHEQDTRGTCPCCKRWLRVIDQALAILKQPKDQPSSELEFTKECMEYINLSPCMSETTCKGYAERLKEACTIIEQS